MKDEKRTKAELIKEAQKLRRKVARLEKSEIRLKQNLRKDKGAGSSGDIESVIFDSISEHIVHQDTDMKVLHANRAAADSVGLTMKDIVGRHCYEIWPQRTDPCPGCPVKKAVETGERQTAEITTPDDRVWLIKGTPVFDKKGKVKGAIEITSEITERMRADEALRESEERYRTLFEDSTDAIYIITLKGEIIEFNQSALDLFGYTKKEVSKLNIKKLYADPSDRKNFQEKIERQESVRDYEIKFRKRDGTEIDCLLTASLRRADDGSILGYQGIIRDITAKKIMEEHMQRAEKLESVGLLAGGLAHDFNNILMAILGNIQIASTGSDSQDEMLEFLTEAEKACFRAKDLTRQLLTFSQGGAPVKETAFIKELIEESAEFALRGSNVKCEFSLPEDLWLVDVDTSQISQVINNLIINADQAMPEGGTIKVIAQNVSTDKESFPALKAGKYLKISIEDQGVGIAEEHLPKIFDPYFTTKQKGSGLGLATTYSIISKHKGHINVESEPGAGTAFHIYLPACEDKALEVEKKAEEEEYILGKGKILFMDDEKYIRKFMKTMIKQIGYDVEAAEDGAEAIRLFEKAMKSNKPFDAVIMDLTVPGGMGGKETIKELLKIDPDVTAIISSGYSNDPVMSEFKNYGFKGVIEKPYKMEELSELLQKIIKK